MRASIRISHLREPSQVVILRGGSDTGDGLARLGRFIDDLNRGGFVEHVVLHRLLFVEGECSSIQTTVKLLVDGATQCVVVAAADVLVGIDAGDAGIGIAIASDGACGVIGAGGIAATEGGRTGDARLLAGTIEGILCGDGSAKGVVEADGSTRGGYSGLTWGNLK